MPRAFIRINTVLINQLYICFTGDWESCSEDNDSDGSWIDVPHSSDEETVSSLINPLTAKLLNWNSHSLEVVSH